MAKRKGQICILFNEVPPGTHYKEGAYSWVNEGEARQYIDKDYGVEYDPNEAKTEEPEIKEPETDIPEDFPGDTYFKQAGIMWMDEIRGLHEDGELQSVDGIGDSTETKIENYFDGQGN